MRQSYNTTHYFTITILKKINFIFIFLFCFVTCTFAQLNHEDAQNRFLQANKLRSFEPADLQSIRITSDHVSSVSGIHHLYFMQEHEGIGIYNAVGSAHFNQNQQLIQIHEAFEDKLSERVSSTSPSLSADEAILSAATELNYEVIGELERIADQGKSKGVDQGQAEQKSMYRNRSISLRDIPARLMYQSVPSGELRLAWDVSVLEPSQTNWWSMRIDAETGKILDKVNWIVTCNIDHDHKSESASCRKHASKSAAISSDNLAGGYQVYAMPLESPAHGDRTIEVDPDDATASPYGWHDTNGAAGAEFTTTQGNNVHAYEDGDNVGFSPDGGAALTFNFPIDTVYTVGNQSEAAVITNLFYWNNVIHDVWYHYGFTEAAGNFQQNNYGNGGAGSDYVFAEAQDGLGTCGAFFGTPADGSNPTMQMLVCDYNGDGLSRDGDLDNLVIVHEYGHGISFRLTGGSSNSGCLNNAEQMGEGWSDWLGLMMTMQAGDTGSDPTTVGTWLKEESINGSGFREYPYSTDLAINPHTYADVASVIAPHGVGSVWCAMLWEMTWALIDQYGFDPDFYNGTGGNNMALMLVIEGMKLQPCSPGFVDGRDAILLADENLYGGTHKCLIWTAFAKRGLGFSADQGSSDSRNDNTEAFDINDGLTLNKSVDLLVVGTGNVLTYTLDLKNDAVCGDTFENVVLLDTLPDHTIYITGSANNGGSEADGVVTYPTIAKLLPGDSIQYTFQVQIDPSLSVISGIYDDMESGPGYWTTTASGSNNWSLISVHAYSGSKHWFAENYGSTQDQYLQLNNTITPNDETIMSFWHSYDTELSYDGGVVQYSLDDGTNWLDLGPYMIQNPYNSTIDGSGSSSSPAFSGNSDGYLQTLIDLSAFVGQSMDIRFWMSTDHSIASDGWYIDDVHISSKFIQNTAHVTADGGIAMEAKLAIQTSVHKDTDQDGLIDFVDLCPDDMDTALDFDGIDDYVTVPHDSVLNVGNGDFTVQAWVNPTGTGTRTILCKGTGHNTTPDETDYLLRVSATNQLLFYYRGEESVSTITVPNNQWSHVALTFDHTTKMGAMYINGVFSNDHNYSSATPVTNDTTPLYIGRQGHVFGLLRFEGRMDDVAIWNKKRTAEEITCSMARRFTGAEAGLVAYYDMNESAACNANTSTTMITDQSSNSLDGMLNNFSLLPGCISNWSPGRNLDSDQNGLGDGCDYLCNDTDGDGITDDIDLCSDYMDTALDFDGIDDFVTVPHDPALNVGTGDFTFEAWLHPASNQYITILSKGFSGSSGTNYKFDITPVTSSTYNIRLFYANDFFVNTTPISLNEWNHVAVTFNFTTKQAVFYLNGVADGTGVYDSDPPNTTGTEPLFIGRGSTSCCNSHEGRMDDVSIWNTVRTASEIAEDMTSVDLFAPGLVMSFDMNESPACFDNTSTTTLVDQSQNNFVGQLNNFSLLQGCTSNWSSGRNLDSDQNGFGDGCDYNCDTGLSVLYVDSSAISGSKLGSSWADAYLRLSDALNHASLCPGIDSIHVAAGTYVPYIGGLANPRTASFVIPDSVNILGQFPTGGGDLSARGSLHKTVLSGDIGITDDNLDNVYHVVVTPNMTSQTSVDGFIITKGFADGAGDDNHGGGWFNDSTSLTVSNCVFIDNYAAQAGGGFRNINSSLTMSNCSFIQCSATNGGGLASDSSSTALLSLFNCQFSSNAAVEGGGGVYLSSTPLAAQNTAFTSNTADYFGGGLSSKYASVSLTGCQFSTNYAESNGGGANFISAPLVAQNVTFANNTADFSGGSGGGFYSSGGTMSLVDCQFSSNNAFTGGGAHLHNSPLTAKNVEFTNNNTEAEGAGLYSRVASISLLDCQFNENSGTTGAGVSAHTAAVSQVKGCIFKFNEALYFGGAYETGGTGQSNFVNCLFEANKATFPADEGGGAIMIYGGDVHLTNSTLVNNHSASQGGAISIFNSTGGATLTNTILWNNTATTDSAIYNGNGGSININHSILDANACLPNVSCGPGMIYNENPLFIDSISAMPMGGDFRPRYPSPAINAGINDSIPTSDTTDLAGLNRIINSIVDMGAYEFNYEFPCGVYGNLAIDDIPVFMGDYKASGLISSEGIINTNSNGPVSFKSENEIELNQGFEVQLGEIFNAVIEDPCVD